MDTLLKKLNFKEEEEILVLNSPPEYKELLKDFSKSTKVLTNIKNFSRNEDMILSKEGSARKDGMI